MKHIESILPEYAADELDRIVREEGDATATAALTALLHSVTGCDIPQTSDLPESEVEELVPLCVSILRRHWQTPLTCLGDGTTPMSLSDLMRQAIGDRVQGNETLGIPPANNADIPTALAALRERKIGGLPEAPDGISLAQLLGSTSAVSAVTEIVDDNTGWVADQRGWLSTILNIFVNLQYAVINCDDMNVSPLIANTQTAAEIHIKTKALSFSQENVNNDMPNVDLWLDELETCNIRAQGQATFRSKSINMPKFKYGTYSIGGSAGWVNDNTKRIYFGCKGVPTDTIILTNASSGSTGSTQALEIIELREGARQRFTLANIPSWDCYPNITAENIVTYILDRLADNSDGDAITITLGTYLLAKLSNEQIAIATNKNYTLA